MTRRLAGQDQEEQGGIVMSSAAGSSRRHPAAEVEDVELYHAHSWWTKYVFSQDAKVIAIQYSITALSIGLVALVLSWLMRLQLGFLTSCPSSIRPNISSTSRCTV